MVIPKDWAKFISILVIPVIPSTYILSKGIKELDAIVLNMASLWAASPPLISRVGSASAKPFPEPSSKHHQNPDPPDAFL